MLYYVKVEKNGIHQETHRFTSWKEAHEYARAVKTVRRGDVEVWLGMEGEGAIKL